MHETKNTDKKPLKFLRGKQTDWTELAKDIEQNICNITPKNSIENAQ